MMQKSAKEKLMLEADSSSDKVGWGQRHVQTSMMFFCLVTAFSMRSSMGVALVAMAPTHDKAPENFTVFINDNNTNTSDGIHKGIGAYNAKDGIYRNFSDAYNSVGFNSTVLYNKSAENIARLDPDLYYSESEVPLFPWNKKTQETIQSSFFWGYMILQLPAGALAHRFGAKYLLVIAIISNGVISILIPYAAIHGGSTGMMVCRAIQGLTQAFVIPSVHTLLGKWAPLEERGRLAAFVHGGQAFGTVMGLPFAGFLAASSRGWPAIFQFYGALATIAGCIWAVFGANSPAHHKTITTKERLYIQKSLGQRDIGTQDHLPVPWKNILTHRGLWANVITHIGASWGQITLYSQIPSYMSNVMKVGIEANGLLTALPFFAMWLATFLFSWISDAVTNRKLLGVTKTRKLFNTVGNWAPALGFLVFGFVPADNIVLTEFVLIGICTLKIAGHLGFMVNHIDISPNFAGTMMSIGNFIASAIASFSPMAAAYFLTDVTDQHLWRYVFFTTSSIYFFTNLVYLVMGTAQLAEWNDPAVSEVEMVFVQNKDTKEKKEKEEIKA